MPLGRQKLVFRKKIEYDRKINENNCFLFALFGISDKFSIHNHANYFKDKPLVTQIELANDVLIKN